MDEERRGEEKSREDNKSERRESSWGRYKTFDSEGSQAVLVRPVGKGGLEISETVPRGLLCDPLVPTG
jgi:hypothetical protein